MNKLKNSKAFTLIEMLVVISLIGILAALALASYAGTQKQARDTNRKSDLKQYQTTFEIFANKSNGLYPSFTGASTIENGSSVCDAFELTNCPADPKNTGIYIYKYISNGSGAATPDATDYAVWTGLEDKTDTYWVLCSNGKIGESDTVPDALAICPL